ncbi:MAG: filamentous hemagglutinin N-terminal domain-containing protein, partial [Schwartzia sp.]|nr:filamentous hemagglutinin N-terminal domain-containing protein [Schwartzia sp. (in: firmicutes)]
MRINTSGQVMNIGSSAVNNVVQWVDFSIAGGETVAFDKNNYLNYVTGHAASEIFGTLTGGGNIFIINPHGILIGHDANVNVGNLYLSTQILSDAQLDAFRACGTSPILDASNANGNVVNLGHLEAKTVVVEGNVIKFKNVAEVDAPTINVFAKTETRVGCEGEPLPDGWRFFRAGTEGQVAPLKYKLINDEADLQKITVNDANGRYMLAGNIKVNNDFTAIGTSSQDQGRFLGHFDGLGYEITFTKKIKANGKTSGLFGAIGEGSVVENVGVITSALEFSSTGSFNDVFVGGVVGDNRKGTIQNVWHSGNIHVDYSCNYLYVGGIVGCNTAGTIMSAYNTGKVFASGAEAPGVAYVGGIAGYQQNEDGAAKPLVENAFNSGMVTAEGPAVIGGIAGAIRGGNIHNVYNLGSVSARTAGGIVGRNDRPGIVSCAYHAAGSISGITKGAIVGVTNDNTGTFEKVLFAETDAENHSLSDTKGTPKSETELKKLETFEQDGWSISSKGGAKTAWRICD